MKRSFVRKRLGFLALSLMLAACGVQDPSGGAGSNGGSEGNGGNGSYPTLTWNLSQFGTNGSDAGEAAAPDQTGGVFIAGVSNQTLQSGYTPQGGTDIFLARYDANLNQTWIVQKGSGLDEDVRALATDADGGVWIAGSSGGALYGAHQGVNGSEDAFIAHYSAGGSLLWATEFGTTEDDVATSLAPGPENGRGVYVGGYTRGDLTGDGWESGYYDAFLRFYYYDTNIGGNPVAWTLELNGGSQVNDGIIALAPAPNGGVYAAGYTEGSLAPGAPNAGGPDAFVIRFDADGTQVWAQQFGTDGKDMVLAAAPSADGGVYLAGTTYGTLVRGEVGGWADAFIARYDANGNRLWIHQIGTGGAEEGVALAVTQDGTVFLAGTTDADLVTGSHQGAYNQDAFLVAYRSDGTRLAWIQNSYDKDDKIKDLAPAGNRVFVVGYLTYETTLGDKTNVLLGTARR